MTPQFRPDRQSPSGIHRGLLWALAAFAVTFMVGGVFLAAGGLAALGLRQTGTGLGAPASPTLSPSSPAEATRAQVPTLTPTPALISTATLSVTLTATPELPLASPTVPITVTVQAGETLSGIAGRFGVSLEALIQVNHITQPDLIRPGDVLTLPIGSAALALWPTESLPLTPATPMPGDRAGTAPPTALPIVSDLPASHWVAAGETLESIAAFYGLEVESLRTANAMYGSAILPGQTLWLTGAEAGQPQPGYAFSTVNEDRLESVYPLALDFDRFSLHYTAGGYPAHDPLAVGALVANALAHLETLYGVPLAGRFDVYTAGTLFENETHLRGRSFSLHRRIIFIHDGSGNATDQQYIAAHELNHLFTWNVFGAPVSVMLSEGASVYAGMELVTGSDHLPIEPFCAAYLQAGQLPAVSGSLGFRGHIYDLEIYYAAGCFVKYLVEAYGPAQFGRLYPTQDYDGVYGKSIWKLEQEWQAHLSTIPFEFDSARLVAAVEAVKTAYEGFFPNFIATPAQLAAYLELDAARLALLEARFDAVEAHLAAHYTLLP